ncbi:MAG: GTPase [Ruminococcaceae bacterium]|nr:GTPase [Oscillospiraceae bacterium]
MNREIAVFLVVGFLDSGKTTFINDCLADPRMNPPDVNALVIACEEGDVEYDEAELKKLGAYVEYFDSADKLTPDRLASRVRRYNAETVFVEYNGMWNLDDLFNAMPDNWQVYGVTFFMDQSTALVYNANMRQLVYDKLSTADTVIFNRLPDDEPDIMPLHKLVRGANRSSDIFYESVSGKTMKDTIEDPLPFDVNAAVIKIADRDFALWFSDMAEDLAKYNGKQVEYLGMVAKQDDMPKGLLAIGRHIMTCCADDIAYNGLACKGLCTDDYKTYDWVKVRGEIRVESCPLYKGSGPVLYVEAIESADEPEDPVATYY